MFSKTFIMPGVVIAMALACGCGSSPPPNAKVVSPSMGQIRQKDLDADRLEFIEFASRRIHELETAIADLRVSVQYEPKFVDGAERTSWSQALLARVEEHTRLQHELERARAADQQEWDAMRGGLATAIDSLDGSVERIGDELETILARADVPKAPPTPEEPMRADTGLCPTMVDAQADADVQEKDGAVVLVLTVDKKETVPELRRKAKTLSGKVAYTPAVSQEQLGTVLPIPARISTQPVEGGVKITLRPTSAAQLATLREAVERDAGYLESRRCATGQITET